VVPRILHNVFADRHKDVRRRRQITCTYALGRAQPRPVRPAHHARWALRGTLWRGLFGDARSAKDLFCVAAANYGTSRRV